MTMEHTLPGQPPPMVHHGVVLEDLVVSPPEQQFYYAPIPDGPENIRAFSALSHEALRAA